MLKRHNGLKNPSGSIGLDNQGRNQVAREAVLRRSFTGPIFPQNAPFDLVLDLATEIQEECLSFRK